MAEAGMIPNSNAPKASGLRLAAEELRIIAGRLRLLALASSQKIGRPYDVSADCLEARAIEIEQEAIQKQEAEDRREAEEDAKIYAEGKKAGGRERAVKELRQLADRIETLDLAGVCAGIRRRAAEIEAEGK